MSDAGKRFRSANLYFPHAPAQGLAGRRRMLDRVLRRLGPSWRAAPVRRGVQILCLGLFLHLFFVAAWPYSRALSGRERLPLEAFLWLDPLVGLSTAIAARCWNTALWGTGAILLAGVLFPRGFCGYLCPLGTLIDAFDWGIGKWVRRFRVAPAGKWARLRYHVLAAVLVASAFGVLLSGYVSAIPVATRGLLLTAGQVQLGLLRNWGQVRPPDAAAFFSLILFLGVFLLSLMGPRFWCRHVCPSGALLSLFSLLRVGERTVEASCTGCGKCRRACAFDAIREDFSTRVLECTFCQTCGGVCPAHAIQFTTRGRREGLKAEGEPPAIRGGVSRRAFLASAAGGAAAAMVTGPALGGSERAARLLRPPGSAPEVQFLDLCIRCGECFQVCPGPVLHPSGFGGGLEALWTPVAIPAHAGCHQECTLCTQVCPTGAIRPLSIEEKRVTRMGLAVLDAGLCLPHRGERDCRLCFDECEAAGYHAIEMREVRLQVGEVPEGIFSPDQVEQMGRITAPFIRAEACVGCGLCEYRCHTALVKGQKLLPRAAMAIVAVTK